MAPKDAKKIIAEEAKRLEVISFISHRDFLKSLYMATKYRMGSYSYLLFAEDLGLSRTNVVRLVITGQRPLTSRAGESIAKALKLAGSERKYWLSMVRYAGARSPADRDKHFSSMMSHKSKAKPKALDAKQAEYFSEWYHPIIREMAGLDGFDGNPEWIKKRLTFPLRIDEINKSLQLLVSIGALRYNRIKNTYSHTDERISTDVDVDHMAMISYHQKMIEAGRESITRVEEDLREIRAVTAALPADKVPMLKARILEFMTEFMDMEDSGQPNNEVYQMNLQLFPFTKK